MWDARLSELSPRWVAGLGVRWLAMALSGAALPWDFLQARKTYQAYHVESVNAEAKLREAERQEEKRAGRSALPTITATAVAAAATTAAATESGPLLRKSSLKKGGRLVEKVGLAGYGSFLHSVVKALSLPVLGSSWGLLCGRRKAGLGRWGATGPPQVSSLLQGQDCSLVSLASSGRFFKLGAVMEGQGHLVTGIVYRKLNGPERRGRTARAQDSPVHLLCASSWSPQPLKQSTACFGIPRLRDFAVR
jgi:hypothetical protein